VYRAIDHERDAHVAIKTLRRVDPSSIDRLKREFRSLSDLTHPNLAALHELLSIEDQWFVVMEFVEGLDFMTYVRGPADVPEEGVAATFTTGERDSATGDAVDFPDGTGEIRAPAPDQLERLRDALRQLAEGVAYLHSEGKLHRDIKPTNVLVTDAGRVVLLDFGLVAELGAEQRYLSGTQEVIGTVAYMSPEQAASSPLTEATDWYSIGTMLFQALTGALPFAGRPLQVLVDKQRLEPPVPNRLAPDIPEDLSTLCQQLLRRNAGDRPSTAEILHRLGAARAVVVASELRTSRSGSTPFVGRAEQLAALDSAFERANRGEVITVLVRGGAGIGKSTLIQKFVADLGKRRRVLTLAGRCYERESVPYKALDGIVDAIATHLSRLPRAPVGELVPSDAAPLARAFPVLRKIERIAKARWQDLESTSPHELRRRAFASLRELLVRLAARCPLVLCVDDAQWGDVDSALLLTDLLVASDRPPMLLIVSYRSADADTSPFLRTLARSRTNLGAPAAQVVVDVGRLPEDEAQKLARALLDEHAASASGRAAELAEESAGNPYPLSELVRHLLTTAAGSQHDAAAAPVTLDDALRARVSLLSESARRLLEVVAVADRPVEQLVATRAAELGADARAELAQLRAAHLVRTRGVRGGDLVECFHNRVRETVVAMLSAEQLAEHHQRLAKVLDALGRAEPEALVAHFRGAGELEQAAGYAAIAAANALKVLAFDRAADLYRVALELRPDRQSAEEVRRLRRALGDALANAGRGKNAAEAYRAAAEDAPAADALALRQQAAEQLFFSGHVDEALEESRWVLERAGLGFPRTRRRALLAVGLARVRLRLRGGRFRRRDRTQVSAEALTRADVCWSLAGGLGLVDPVRSYYFHNRHYELALQLGEPFRVARAFALEAAFLGTAGSRTSARATRMLDLAGDLSGELDRPSEQTRAQGVLAFAKAWSAYFNYQWRQTRELSQQAEQLLRGAGTGVFWHLANTQLVLVWSSCYLGEVEELPRRVPSLIHESEARGDQYLATNLRTGSANTAWLVADDPDGARRAVDEAKARWARFGEYNIQQYDHLFALGQIDLYCGQGRPSWERISEGWAALEKSLLLTVQMIRVEMYHLRARSALAMAADAPADSPERRELMRSAERDARRIEKEKERWAAALAQLVRASLARLRDDDERATELLRAAIQGFDATQTGLHAAVARRRLGDLIGGAEGDEARQAATSFMRSHGIANPDGMTAMLAPGFEHS